MLDHLFSQTILSEHLCEKEDKILVAVSGGKDSMALLHLFLKAGYRIEVAHFNFKLRSEESDKDEKLVREYCLQNNILCHVNAADTKKYAKDNGLSTQLAARKLRYDWFNKLHIKQGLQYISTAHHLNDNLETLILNLIKGTGPKGLVGIPIKTHYIIRPLLYATSEQIMNYLVENNIPWREDASNQENYYYRNKLRNQVIPLLKEINPGLEKTTATNLSRFKNLNAVFQQELDKFRKEIIIENNIQKIPLSYLDEITGSQLILEEYLKHYGFVFEDIETLTKLTETGKFILSSTHKVTLIRDYYVLSDNRSTEFKEFKIKSTGQLNWENGQLILEEIDAKNLEFDFIDKNMAYLDAEKITWPLHLRPWKNGDRFKPFGMKGTKLVSDFLKDEGIDAHLKENHYVLLSNEKIVWVLGKRIDNNFRITPETKSILKIHSI